MRNDESDSTPSLRDLVSLVRQRRGESPLVESESNGRGGERTDGRGRVDPPSNGRGSEQTDDGDGGFHWVDDFGWGDQNGSSVDGDDETDTSLSTDTTDTVSSGGATASTDTHSAGDSESHSSSSPESRERAATEQTTPTTGSALSNVAAGLDQGESERTDDTAADSGSVESLAALSDAVSDAGSSAEGETTDSDGHAEPFDRSVVEDVIESISPGQSEDSAARRDTGARSERDTSARPGRDTSARPERDTSASPQRDTSAGRGGDTRRSGTGNEYGRELHGDGGSIRSRVGFDPQTGLDVGGRNTRENGRERAAARDREGDDADGADSHESTGESSESDRQRDTRRTGEEPDEAVTTDDRRATASDDRGAGAPDNHRARAASEPETAPASGLETTPASEPETEPGAGSPRQSRGTANAESPAGERGDPLEAETAGGESTPGTETVGEPDAPGAHDHGIDETTQRGRRVVDAVSEASNVLVLGSHEEADSHCAPLLHAAGGEEPATVLVGFGRTPTERIDAWRSHPEARAHSLSVLTVGGPSGGRETVSDTEGVAGTTTVKRVGDPTDLTRLGITISRMLTEAESGGGDDSRPVACIHSLTEMLQYVERDRLFRFLHLLQNRISSSDGAAHYHMDPAAHEPEVRRVFESLFDVVVEVNGDRVQLVGDR